MVMRKHQRYFPVYDSGDELQPVFVTVANGPIDKDLVRVSYPPDESYMDNTYGQHRDIVLATGRGPETADDAPHRQHCKEQLQAILCLPAMCPVFVMPFRHC